MQSPRAAGRTILSLALALLLGCTALRPTGPAPDPVPRHLRPAPELDPPPLDPAAVRVESAPLTVGDEWILHIYTFFHARDYQVLRLSFPGSDGEEALAYLYLPAGPGPHPAVVLFPILAGSHVVSEALAKALVRRGYAVLHMQRRPLELETAERPEVPMEAFRHAIRDARALLGWLAARPDIDATRIAAAGVSLGGILAATLMGVDARICAGYFALTGGGLAEILYDSSERPVRAFRERMRQTYDLRERAQFLEFLRPYAEALDPLRYASAIPRDSVLVVSGRFDRVMPPERTRALWLELGQPTWLRVPAGHYQFLPFFWWAAARGADHFDRVLDSDACARPGAPQS